MKSKVEKVAVCVLAIALFAGVAQADITSNLVDHWKLDDGSGSTATDSVGSHNGTLVTPPDPQFVSGGQFGGAVDFAGGTEADSYVNCGDGDSLDITGSRTISTWVKIDEWGANWTGVITKGDVAGNYDLIRNVNTNNVGFYIADGNGGFVVGDDNVADGEWHLLTGVYDDAGTMSMYVDGQLDASISVTGGATATNNQPLVLNGLNDGNTGWDHTRHNDCMMDDVRVYRRALTASDVEELYNADVTMGPVGHWKLDDGSGSIATDSVGSHNGTLVTPPDPQFVSGGQFGGAVDFAGGTEADSYVNCGDGGSLDITGSRTISTWVKIDEWGAHWTGIITKGDVAGNYDIIRNRDADSVRFYMADVGEAIGTVDVADGEWHLLTGVYDDAGEMFMYVDGVLDGYASVTGGATVTNNQPLVLNGLNDGNTGWDHTRHNDCMMDDVRLYNWALTASDVEELYNRSHYAHDPDPKNFGNFDPDGGLLTWSPGNGAYSHDVYFGSDESAVSSLQRSAGDIDGNGVVDGLDLNELCGQWLGIPQEPFADLTGEGKVNLADISILASDWNKQTSIIFKGNQTAASYSTGDLVEGHTYYWRVDEVSGAQTFKGAVWEFIAGWGPLDITIYPGWDIYTEPGGVEWFYRYGPSIIINDDDSIDVWTAGVPGAGGSGQADWIYHKKSTDGGNSWGTETVALRPTSGSEDAWSTCDPGVIKFGGYYYIGYTSSENTEGYDNHVYVARSTTPTPYTNYQKWNGSGWGGNPVKLITYTGTAGQWGAGEPSFVLKDGTIYVYYTWKDGGDQMRLSTADASNPNWPGALTYQGVVLDGKVSGEDSCDVKYIDSREKFISVSVCQRFTTSSYIKFRESTDGTNFTTTVEDISENTMPEAHNGGISGTETGHLNLTDDNFISYAYGPTWGLWNTYLNPINIE